MKKTITTLLILAGSCLAQNLPDAPQPQAAPVYTDYTVHNTPSTFKAEPRGKKKLIVLGAVLGFAVIADIYDVRSTERAVSKGYIESNDWLVGPRPSARALYGRDLMVLGISATPSILSYVYRRPELFYGFLSSPAIVGVKHIQGYVHNENLQ